MYGKLVTAILGVTLIRLGRVAPDLPAQIFTSRKHAVLAMRIVSRIDWKPISIFPEEAKRFGKVERRCLGFENKNFIRPKKVSTDLPKQF